jgi:hypothetical protein
MKKLFLIIMATLFCLSLARCSNKAVPKPTVSTFPTTEKNTSLAEEEITLSEEQSIFYYEYNSAHQEGNKIKNFEKIYGDLMVMVNYVDKHRIYFVDSEDRPFFITQYYGELRLDGIREPLTEQEMNSLKNICDAFRDSSDSLDLITFFPGRVSFDKESDEYSLVYTEDDSLPAYMTWPDDDRKIRVEKIRPHWYHVMLNTAGI